MKQLDILCNVLNTMMKDGEWFKRLDPNFVFDDQDYHAMVKILATRRRACLLVLGDF